MESPSEPITSGDTSSSPFRRPPQPKPVPVVSRSASVNALGAAVQPTVVNLATTGTPAAGAAPAGGTVSSERQRLEYQRRKGGRWFYWIAGLSLINSVAAFTGQNLRFIIGLGATRVADTMAARSGTGWTAAALVDLLLIGGFVLLGHCAIRGRLWASVVGIMLYAADGLIFLALRNWINVGFHAFVLVMMFRGLQAGHQRAPSRFRLLTR